MAENKVREASVAGKFYPGSKDSLIRNIEVFMDSVDLTDLDYQTLYGGIAPHAGYPFSGPIAAYTYSLISEVKPKNIVIIAPSHQEYVEKFSLYPGDYFETPIGKVPINKELGELIGNQCENLEKNTSGHNREHSLEVQLPFLQYILEDDFEIVPIAAGNASKSKMNSLAEALSSAYNEQEFLMIASSDLSHYYSYDEAMDKDRKFISALEKYDTGEIYRGYKNNEFEACGIIPIITMMMCAENIGNPKFKELDYRNSGDTAGSKGQVVGYLAGAIYE